MICLNVSCANLYILKIVIAEQTKEGCYDVDRGPGDSSAGVLCLETASVVGSDQFCINTPARPARSITALACAEGQTRINSVLEAVECHLGSVGLSSATPPNAASGVAARAQKLHPLCGLVASGKQDERDKDHYCHSGGVGLHEQDWPTRPITMVVPFAAGGAGDILSRMLGPRLQQKWGHALIVDNKPGGGGVIAANAVAKAAPDGYTLLIAPSAIMAVNVTLYKSLSYDPTADFVPLALAAQTPFVLVVNPDLPVRSVQDLIKYVKDRPGQISYATAGVGVPHHLFAELLKTMTGINMSPVAYRGSLPALNDVVAGHVPLMFVDLGPSLGLIQAGKVRALGVSTATRVAAIGDIPPIAEVGVPGFDAASWQMIVAPANTPPPIVEKLHSDFKSALAAAEIKDQILKNGMLPMENPSVAGLQSFVRSEIARWSKLVQQAGIARSQ